MKLATRVSAFFLVAIAIILIGNSVLLFALARIYLLSRFDDQMQSTLHTLVAAVEIKEDHIKWEPTDHAVNLANDQGVDGVHWIVRNEAGKILELSQFMPPEGLGKTTPPQWRSLRYQVAAQNPKAVEHRGATEHAELMLTVSRSFGSLQHTLNLLAATLTGLSILCWTVSLLVGRKLCQQAIRPLSQMARSAREIQAGTTSHWLSVPNSRDELEDMGKAFNDLLSQLFSAYDRQKRFTGDAAHQLRTPLTVLQGQVDVALRRKRSVAEYESTLEIISDEIGSLSKTVETLLFLARSEHQAAQIDAERVEMLPWLEQYVQRWKGDPRRSDLKIQCQPSVASITSPSLLTQVLDALISNALKYSPEGSTILLRASLHNSAVLLEVEDKGLGIPEEDIASVFLPFYRSRSALRREHPGTGLGLAIAERLARIMGGKLECSSQLGHGSRFSLHLPPRAMRQLTSSAPLPAG